MAHLQWRKFRFFEKEDKVITDSNLKEALRNIEITCTASGKGSICIGTEDGAIHVLDRGFERTVFQAFSGKVTNLQQLKLTNLLIASGREIDSSVDLIKVYNLDKTDISGQFVCMRTLKVHPGKDSTLPALTCFAVHENLTLLAAGFSDGFIVLYKGDVSKENSGKLKVIEQRPPDALTNLLFSQTAGPQIVLYATTGTKVWSYVIDNKYERLQKLENDKGCPARCAVLSDQSQENQLVTGLPEAVYFYSSDEKGQCLAFEGEKLMIAWHKNYLITVTKDNIVPPAGKDFARPALTPVRDMFTVNVYDVSNKYIAFWTGGAKMTGVKSVVCEWGSIFIIGLNNSFCQLRELDTQKKLDILFSKNQFDMAISLARTQQYDKEGLTDIFMQYGDYLYQRGDYDGSVQQYIKTIDRLEPSYVIRKFLDAHRIHNLTTYLQQLHKEKKAKAEHTTLLLNCYTKLKDTTELNNFIQSKDEKSFDVHTAIKVCREAQYFDHALRLASLKKEHQWYVRILLEDKEQYEETLTYLNSQSFDVVQKNMLEHGKKLVDALPKQTTELLKRLCTNFGTDPETGNILRADPTDYIKLYVMEPDYLVEFLEFMTGNVANLSPIVYNTLFELYLKQFTDSRKLEAPSSRSTPASSYSGDRKLTSVENKAMSLLRDSKAPYDMDQALILCQMHDFREGILYLYEKAHLYKHIVKYHMDHLEFDKVIEMCKAHGDKEASLWRDALIFFGKHEQADGMGQNLKYVLEVIEERELLSPLLVVQSLAQNTDVKVGVLKEYLTRKFKHESNLIKEEESQIKKLENEISTSQKRINQIKHEPQQFPEKSKCSTCAQDLYNPSVHFYCRHSYHQHCFESYSDNDQCPLCVANNQRFNDQWASISNRNQLQEEFHGKLSNTSSDGFSLVSQYFGFGVLNEQK